MRHFVITLITMTSFATVSCATFRSKDLTRASLNFSNAEHIATSKLDQEKTTAIIGKPDLIVAMKEGANEIWSYNEPAGASTAQRFNLVFDRHTGALQTAIWMPREGEDFYSRDKLFAHLKESKFIARKELLKYNHYSSEEVFYEDERTGVAIYPGKHPDAVVGISWSKSAGSSVAAKHD